MELHTVDIDIDKYKIETLKRNLVKAGYKYSISGYTKDFFTVRVKVPSVDVSEFHLSIYKMNKQLSH